MAKLNRHELADAVAIERAEYEREFASRPDGWQPLYPFVRAAALRIARDSERGVDGIRVRRDEYGVTLTARVDFKKLTATVERRLPRWRETVARVEAAAS